MLLDKLLNERDIVIVIGSGEVSGAVVDIRPGNKPQVVHTHEFDFPVKDSVDAHDLLNQTLSALHAVLTGLHKEYKSRVKVVHVVISSPWFVSFSKNLSSRSESGFNVTPEKLEGLAQELFAELTRGRNGFSDESILEKAVSKVRINGYDTVEPFGKKAKNLEAAVYISAMEDQIKEKIENEIFAVIHPGKVEFHTLPFAAWSTISTIFPKADDFLFIDVGGEITDLLLSRRGSIEKIASLPYGENQLSRKIALNFGIQPELANSLLSLYSSELLDRKTDERIRNLVISFGREWLEHLFSAFRSDSHLETLLPGKIYLASDVGVDSVFATIVSSQLSEPVLISKKNVSGFVEYGKNNLPDSDIAMSVIHVSGLAVNSGFGKKQNAL